MIGAHTRNQFLRYAIVGLVSNLLLYLAYLGLTSKGLEPKTAMTLLYALGVIMTFLFNRKWSFRYKGRGHSAFARYVISYLLGYLLNFALLWLSVDYLCLPHQGVQAVAIVFVAVSLFLIHKYWVFAPSIRSSSA